MNEIKTAARRAAFSARKIAFDKGQGCAADHLTAFLAQHQGKTVAGYMPMRTEIDPLPAMAAHHGRVAVPVIEAEAQPLRFREWSQHAEMVEGAFKALIPLRGDWLVPDLVIVPLLAFDARGFRLGYGGGFYDRTLEMLRAQKPVLAIGFAFDTQEVPEVPVEATDQKLDLLITESGLRRFG